jgi:hypothetical protein
MKIKHTWFEDDSSDEWAWAVFSQKELAAQDWTVPAGWRVCETADNENETEGLYLIRKTK